MTFYGPEQSPKMAGNYAKVLRLMHHLINVRNGKYCHKMVVDGPVAIEILRWSIPGIRHIATHRNKRSAAAAAAEVIA